MRILYGVVGEGMGHATRSRVVITPLAQQGHDVLVAVSGRAHAFLHDALTPYPNVRVVEVGGLTFAMSDGEIQKRRTLWKNVKEAPAKLLKNIGVYAESVRGFDAELTFSDFESLAYFYARAHDIPVVSVDNMQVLNRCQLPHDVTAFDRSAFRSARALVKAKLPGAYHYLVTSFFFPPVKRPRTTLVPPILRPAVLEAKRGRGDHILVYVTGQNHDALTDALQRLSGNFRVYGAGREGTDGNVTYCPFSSTGFVDDLASARAVVGNAGFSLMSEAVHLGVPMLALPIRGQFEQTLNARFLDRLGYGRIADELTDDTLSAFLDGVDAHQEALATYPRQDNTAVLACVDALVRHVALDEPTVEVLEQAPPALNVLALDDAEA